MLDGRDHEIFLRPEVVDLRATGDAGELGYPRRGGARVAVSHQTLDGGVQQPRPHGGSAFCLRSPNALSVDFRRHSDPHSGILTFWPEGYISGDFQVDAPYSVAGRMTTTDFVLGPSSRSSAITRPPTASASPRSRVRARRYVHEEQSTTASTSTEPSRPRGSASISNRSMRTGR